MNFFTFSSILIVISCFISSVLLFRESKKNKSILIWGFVNATATLWGIGAIIFSTTKNYNTAIFGWQIGCSAGILAPLVYHHFVLAYLNRINKRTLCLLYAYGLIAIVYNFLYPQYFFGNLEYLFDQFYFLTFLSLNGLPYFIHYILAVNILLLYSFSLLIRTYNTSKKENQNRHKYLILASGIGWLGTHSNYFSSIFHNVYPRLNILLAFFPLIITYAIIRHQLLDIKVVIKKSLIYSIFIAFIFFFFLITTIIFEKYAQSLIGYNSIFVSIILAVIIGLFALPVRNRIQSIVERYIFKGTNIEIAEKVELLEREVADKEKHKAIATLASGIAHEVRNPITTLKIFFEHLPQKKSDPEFMAKLERLGNQEFGRIEKLVQQLLDFAKPSPPTFQKENINEVIEDTLALIDNKLLKHNIYLSKTLAPKPLTLNIDKNQIKQALLNIFLNAIDAMPTGGTLTVETQVHDGQYAILISDTGRGIAKEDLKHIFDPFYSKKDGGTGLGLAITKSIIEKHKGKLYVENISKGFLTIIKLKI